MEAEPACVAETLAWCNSIRADQGKPPLEHLPKGKRFDPESCPCGLATGASVERAVWFPAGKKDCIGEERSLPVPVRDFVRSFDLGMLPHYEEEV